MENNNYQPINSEKLFQLFETITNPLMKKELMDFKGYFSDSDKLCYDGHLEVEGVYQPNEGVVVINGDLKVTGNIVTSAEESTHTFLVVLGDVYCHNLLADIETTTFICGKINVTDLLFTATRDSVFYAADDINAKYIYSGNGAGWINSLGGTITCTIFDGYIENEKREGRKDIIAETLDEELAERFVDSVVNFDDWNGLSDEEREEEEKFDYCYVDEDAVFKVFKENKSIIQ